MRDSSRSPGQAASRRQSFASGDGFNITGTPQDTLRSLIAGQSGFRVQQLVNQRELAEHFALLPTDTLIHGLNQTGESPVQPVLIEALSRKTPWTADAAAFKNAALGIHNGKTRHRFSVSYFTAHLPHHTKSVLQRMGIVEELNPLPGNTLWTNQFVADTMFKVPLPRFEETWNSLDAVTDARLRRIATQALFGNKYQADPEAASAWLNSQPPGEGRRLAALYMIDELEREGNTADAAAWRDSLKDIPGD